MLFTFGKFWKTILFILASWGVYALGGFEFTVISILALMYSKNFKDTHGFL